jgi:outer membrane protein assembly factor BamB
LKVVPGGKSVKKFSFMLTLAMALTTGAFANAPEVSWTFATNGPIRSQPVVTPDRVFITSGDGCAYALDRQGKLVWKTTLGNGPSWASPSLDEQGLAVVSGGSTLQLLDPLSGRVLWTRTTGRNLQIDAWDYHHSTPLWLPGRIVFGSGDGFLYSVDPATGTVQWKTDTRPDSILKMTAPAHSSPVFAEGAIYFASALGDVWAIDPSTGKIQALLSLGRRIDGTPTIDGGQLFVGSRNASFFAATLKPFKEIWKYTSEWGGWMTSSAAVLGNLVIAGSSDDRTVFAWDRRTGEIVWSTRIGGNVFSRIVVTPMGVLASSGNAYEPNEGNLYALSATDGKVLWSIKLDGDCWATPAWDGKEIFVGDESGTLRVLKL